MADINFDYHPQFFTATILNWMPLLADDQYKDIIIKSLRFLKDEQSVKIYAFVIMPNHMHLIWQIQDGHDLSKVQLRLLKFTAQQFKFRLGDTGNDLLRKFKVALKDREYQFWQRNPLSIDLWTPDVFMQKLDYIHNNPLQEKWKLAEYPEDYKYSSARFYMTGDDEFDLVTHYSG
jgi:REP element-mobilizing transposase RayT